MKTKDCQVQEKACSYCKAVKPLSEYHKSPNGRYGLQSRCKECAKELARQYYHSNPEIYTEKVKRWRASNPERTSRYSYTHGLKKNFGIGIETYEDMLERQEGLCAICGANEPGRKKKYFCVDHDHATGEIRGLLCGACNDGLGKFRDNITSLKLAIKYLERADF